MEILSGTDISGEVIKLIDSARQSLVLVSAYFEPWKRLSDELRRAAARPGLKSTLLLRGGKEQAKHAERAAELVKLGMKVEYLDLLHAKVYLSESQAILTSLNLLESSALNSWEMAVRLDRHKDAAAYEELVRHVAALFKRAADQRALPAPPPTDSKTSKRTPTPYVAGLVLEEEEEDDEGACIRCGSDIDYDPDKPMCRSCYREWAKRQNEDDEESFCHACGEEHATSMAKPLCRPCWRAQP